MSADTFPRPSGSLAARIKGAELILRDRAIRARHVACDQSDPNSQYAASLRGKAKGYDEAAELLNRLDREVPRVRRLVVMAERAQVPGRGRPRHERPGIPGRHCARGVGPVVQVASMNATLGLEVYADRCSGCGFHIATQGCACPGNALKFDGMARATSSAAPDDRSRVDAAIRKVARQGEVFSANDVRPLIEGVPGPLVGARFNAAAKAGVIVRVGYEPSTQARTHAHPIAQWRAA